MKIVGQKIKMTQIWQDEKVIPVTVIKYVAEKDAELSIKEGDMVKVTGISKGRGFQGVVKRHGFRGGNKTHGNKRSLRAPGSIGSTAPQRVVPGRRMAGHMGMTQVSIKNLTVAAINKDESTIMLKGAVPGMRGSKIIVTTSHPAKKLQAISVGQASD